MRIMKDFTITIGRQFGSGGRELGKLVAGRLGIGFYDKELMLQAARQSGLSPEFIENNDERTPRFISGILSFNLGCTPIAWYGAPSSINDDRIHNAQCDIIRSLARQGPCVIVGRCADYVLRDMDNVINIFVHAPVEACVKRIIARGDCNDERQAREMVEKTNKLRAGYYNFYTDKRWGEASGYDLTIDSSRLPMERIAGLVIDYVRERTA